jgi:hypothetical protein
MLWAAGLVAEDRQPCAAHASLSTQLNRAFIAALPVPAGKGPSLFLNAEANLENCLGKNGVDLGVWGGLNPRQPERQRWLERDVYVRVKRQLGKVELSGYAGRWFYPEGYQPPKPKGHTGSPTYTHDDVIGIRAIYHGKFTAVADVRKVLTSGWTRDQNFGIFAVEKGFEMKGITLTPGVVSSFFDNVYGYNVGPAIIGPSVKVSRQSKAHPGLECWLTGGRNISMVKWAPNYTIINVGIGYRR